MYAVTRKLLENSVRKTSHVIHLNIDTQSMLVLVKTVQREHSARERHRTSTSHFLQRMGIRSERRGTPMTKETTPRGKSGAKAAGEIRIEIAIQLWK